MLKRKILSFAFTIILSAPIVGLSFMFIEGSTITEIPGLIIFTCMYAIPVTLLYGVPMSILSDLLVGRFVMKNRGFFALIIHLLFGISFVYLCMIMDSRFYLNQFNDIDLNFLVGSIIISFIFWGMDESLRKHFIERENTIIMR